jgi:hypothetical protein
MQRSLVLLPIDSNWQFDVMLKLWILTVYLHRVGISRSVMLNNGQDIDDEGSKRCKIAHRLG